MGPRWWGGPRSDWNRSINEPRGIVPTIHTTAYVAPTAVVMGDVTLGAESSVWYTTVIRGDMAPITIGAQTNIQDGTIVHVDAGFPCVIGERCGVGAPGHPPRLHGGRRVPDRNGECAAQRGAHWDGERRGGWSGGAGGDAGAAGVTGYGRAGSNRPTGHTGIGRADNGHLAALRGSGQGSSGGEVPHDLTFQLGVGSCPPLKPRSR